MTDDIVTRLQQVERLTRNCSMDVNDISYFIHWCAEETERLRRALDLAVGELSLNDKYRLLNPEQLRQQLLDEVVRGGL